MDGAAYLLGVGFASLDLGFHLLAPQWDVEDDTVGGGDLESADGDMSACYGNRAALRSDDGPPPPSPRYSQPTTKMVLRKRASTGTSGDASTGTSGDASTGTSGDASTTTSGDASTGTSEKSSTGTSAEAEQKAAAQSPFLYSLVRSPSPAPGQSPLQPPTTPHPTNMTPPLPSSGPPSSPFLLSFPRPTTSPQNPSTAAESRPGNSSRSLVARLAERAASNKANDPKSRPPGPSFLEPLGVRALRANAGNQSQAQRPPPSPSVVAALSPTLQGQPAARLPAPSTPNPANTRCRTRISLETRKLLIARYVALPPHVKEKIRQCSPDVAAKLALLSRTPTTENVQNQPQASSNSGPQPAPRCGRTRLDIQKLKKPGARHIALWNSLKKALQNTPSVREFFAIPKRRDSVPATSTRGAQRRASAASTSEEGSPSKRPSRRASTEKGVAARRRSSDTQRSAKPNVLLASSGAAGTSTQQRLTVKGAKRRVSATLTSEEDAVVTSTSRTAGASTQPRPSAVGGAKRRASATSTSEEGSASKRLSVEEPVVSGRQSKCSVCEVPVEFRKRKCLVHLKGQKRRVRET